jgi:molybdopterin-guanine dinucleotide biosynthesis protein A
MALPATSRAGFLLAGGKSTRMGRDKAFLEFDGQTLLDRALNLLAGSCPSVAIVGDPARFPNYERVVADVFPGCGPLAGIHAALAHSSAGLNLVLAVDMPWVSLELLAFLFATAESNHATVNVPRIGHGLQPLCAVYRPQFLPVAERALREGNYKVDAAFAAVSTRIIEAAELAAAGFSERNFVNVNTPADLLAGRE